MNIAITSLYLPSGSKIGVGYQVHYLANALVGRGHRVTVLSACPRPADAAYDVRVVPARRRLRTFGFAWDLRRIDLTKFDVLNAHGDDWFLWGVRRPRHIHTYHGSCLQEMLNVRGAAGCLRMAALAACETQAALLADETVAVSENTRRTVPGVGHVIPCGVDTEVFRPASDEKADRPTVLFVGTMHGRKRGALLLEQFREAIRPRLPGAQLWCVCDRPTDTPDEPGVTWFGRVPLARLVELYQRAWVFCLPSTYEGFGVPYIEAMAAGTPVVATPNPGATEVLQGGRSGRLGEIAEIPALLTELLTEADKRARLRDIGFGRAADFAWPTVVERYERLYGGDDATGRHRSASPPAEAGLAV